MQITCTLTLLQGDHATDLAGNSEELAALILEAVGGDISKDICNVTINDSGTAGSFPTGPPPGPIPTPVTVNSTFATNNTPPPGDKQTRTNAAALSAVSAIYVDNNSTEGDDISTQLLPLAVGDRIELRSASDETRYGIFTLSAAPINQGSFVEIPVNLLEAGSPLTNSACTLTFNSRS